VFTGLRAGEKLYEELLADDEHTLPTPHPKLRIAQARPVAREFLEEMSVWLRQQQPVSDEEVRLALRHWLPEYLDPAPAAPPVLAAAH